MGIARPDIVVLYNNNAYLNSGYQMFWPVSSLSLGKHHVTVTAINSGGLSTTLGPLTFTVAAIAGAGVPFGGIDKAVDSVTLSSTVGQANSVKITGWVADPQDGAPMSNVNVFIDGTSIGAPTLGFARADIGANYGSMFLNSGFQLLYPASSLALGTHQVTVTAIDSGGRSKTIGPHAFTVATIAGPGSPFGGIDGIVDSVTGTGPVSQSGSLLLHGWMADPQDGAPLSNVKVYIDGTLIGTPTLGYSRADIAKAFGNAYLHSGFRLIHSASSLAVGTHQVTVIAIDSGGRSTTLAPHTFIVQ
jgi:hypothetical protein